MDQWLVHMNFPRNSYGPMSLKVLWKFQSSPALVHRVLFPDLANCRSKSECAVLFVRQFHSESAIWTRKVPSRQHRALENAILRCLCLRWSGLRLPHREGRVLEGSWGVGSTISHRSSQMGALQTGTIRDKKITYLTLTPNELCEVIVCVLCAKEKFGGGELTFNHLTKLILHR